MTFPIIPASTINGSYQISRSLRFRSSASAYLSRTPASAGNRKTWTWSGWVKRGALSTSATFTLFTANYNTAPWFALQFVTGTPTDQIQITFTAGSAAGTYTNAVFRDPSSWYHIVLAVDTTQSTASNRLKLYVNGLAQTFSSTNYPSLNTDYQVNNNVSHIIGGNSGEYFDGYLAEVNFIDGSALTPSSFGAFDTNGVWQPARYTGSYGTNGFYLPFSASVTSTYAGSFSTNKTITTPQTNTLYAFSGDFTVEGWINPSALSGYQGIIAYSTSSGWNGWQFTTNGANLFFEFLTGSAGVGTVTTSSSPLTANVWQHVAAVRSGSTITIYVNGVSQASGTYASVQNSSTSYVGIGSDRTKNSAYFGGSISNIRVVNGTAVYTANFVPSSNPLTAVTNTQLLTLQNSSIVDNSTNGQTLFNNNTVTTSAATPWSNYIAGVDSSGLNNNWASANVNVTSSGTTYDSMIDSPTNYADGGTGRGNYAVLNPLSGSTGTLQDGNLYYYGPTGWAMRTGTLALPASSKIYFEATLTAAPATPRGQTSAYQYVGVGLATNFNITGTSPSGNNVNSCMIGDGGYLNNFASSASDAGVTFVNGDVIGVAIDTGANTYAFYKNGGTAFASGTINVASGTQLVPIVFSYSNAYGNPVMNFGQRPFAQTVPSGFSALNTQNLPTPTIAAGNKYFDALLYAGNGSSSQRTDISWTNMQPDFVWIKNRTTAVDHVLSDDVRGVTNYLASDTTAAEAGPGGYGTDGFGYNGVSNQLRIFTSDSRWNASSANYVAWGWKGSGAAAVSNTSGSITSTVSANTSAGFSVVTWAGNSTSGATIGHGLGVSPSMIITKSRTNLSSWVVGIGGISGFGVNDYLTMNTTNAKASSSTFYQAYGSSTFTVGVSVADEMNKTGNNYVSYCFAPVAGYSAFGSYTGNASTDGPMIFTGFRPRWLLVKIASGGTGNWELFDSSRNTYNQMDLLLLPSSSNAESGSYGSYYVDFLSNGFKIRGGGTGFNASGETIIYAAFAETPFKYSRAR